jgi:GT2 family glycosyltransferase
LISILAGVYLSKGPRVFVVLLNYRNPADTLRCMASLRSSTIRSIHPVVVDNASGNGDARQLSAALGPAVPVLETGENLGYAGGNNVGIRYALERDADFIWILNPDTEVEPDTLQGLLTTMTLRPDAGFAGSLNLFGDSEPPIVQFAGGHIDWDAGAIAVSIGRGKPLASRPQRDPYEVDYVAGTSMLVRRSVFADVGLLPEHYFLYFEETDFQVTAATQHSWKSVINPLAKVWHFQASAMHLPAPYYTYYYIRGRILFAHKFTDCSDERIVAGLDGFIEGWRARVSARAPEWLDTYNRLVSWALDDGRAGVTGPRASVDGMNRAGE